MLVYTPRTYIVSVCLLLGNKKDIRGDLKQTHKLTKNCAHLGEKKLKNTKKEPYIFRTHIFFILVNLRPF